MFKVWKERREIVTAYLTSSHHGWTAKC